MGKGSGSATALLSQGFLNLQEGDHFPSHAAEKQQGQERNPTCQLQNPGLSCELGCPLPEYGLVWEIGTLLTFL